MLKRLWLSILHLFLYIPSEQRTILAHILQISSAHPEAFKFNSETNSWSAAKFKVEFYTQTGNIYIGEIKYPMNKRAQLMLCKNFTNVHLMLHYQEVSTVFLDLANNKNTFTPVINEEDAWIKENFNLEKYVGALISAKKRNGEIVKRVIVEKRDFDASFPYKVGGTKSFDKKGYYLNFPTKSKEDIVAIRVERY